MANEITWDAKWLPPPKLGRPTSVSAVPAERGAKVLVDGMRLLERELLSKAKAVLQQEAAAIHAEATNGVPVDLGQLKQSGSVTAPTEFEREITFRAPYAAYIEYGTYGGGNPPRDKIVAWAKRKGIAEPERAAYFIQRKIRKFGTPAQPFLFPAFERHRGSFFNRMRELFT